MSNPRSILVIDADANYRRNAARFLGNHGYTVYEADSSSRGIDEARARKPRFALVDLAFQAHTSVDLVEQLRGAVENLDVICVAKGCSMSHVVMAVKAGALDILERPVDGERLVRLLTQANEPRAAAPVTASENRPAGVDVNIDVDVDVVESPAMRRAVLLAEKVAGDARSLVIEGEAGAGHEVIARYFHRSSERSEGDFVKVPAVPTAGRTPHDLLFGAGDEVSAFSKAKGGIVFVESLLSLGAEGLDRLYKLLDGLRTARAAGSDIRWPPMVIGVERPLAVEVKAGRVPAALAEMLESNVVTVPALRERSEDLPLLVERVVQAIQAKLDAPEVAVDPAVVENFASRPWDRNLPELIATICRAAAYDRAGRLVLDPSLRHEPEPVAKPTVAPTPAVAPAPEPEVPQGWSPTLDDSGQVQPYDVYEAEIFGFALEKAGGCVSRAAELLGVGRATMYRKMRAYDITVPPVSERTMARSRHARKARAAERAAREQARSAQAS